MLSSNTKVLSLNEKWNTFWIGEHFGWGLLCKEHEPNPTAKQCDCMAPEEVWQKIQFLDKMWKIK